jgi:hypothetical protein
MCLAAGTLLSCSHHYFLSAMNEVKYAGLCWVYKLITKIYAIRLYSLYISKTQNPSMENEILCMGWKLSFFIL